MPIGMTVSDEGVLDWLQTRLIPKNREFVHQILSRSGLSENDTLGIIELCKGLSLNDSYWVVERGFQGSFSKIQFVRQSFLKHLGIDCLHWIRNE